MKDFKITAEPYSSRVDDLLTVENLANNNDILIFSGDLAYNIAKSTGLRSNKKRHIKKRFKLVIIQALNAFVKDLQQ